MKKITFLILFSSILFAFKGGTDLVAIKGSIVDDKENFQQHEIILIENGEKNADVVTPAGSRFELVLEYNKQFVLIAKRKDQSLKKLFIDTDAPSANNGYVVNLKLILANMVESDDASIGIMKYTSGRNKFEIRPIQKGELKDVEKLYPNLYTFLN